MDNLWPRGEEWGPARGEEWGPARGEEWGPARGEEWGPGERGALNQDIV